MSEKKHRRKEKPLDRRQYYDYLKTAAWQKKRIERLKADGYSCQMCGAKHGLNVHHLTYLRLGCERMEDLITLCGNCHEKVHASMKWEEQYKNMNQKRAR